MKNHLESLKGEMQRHIEQEGFVVFHGHSRMMETQALVFWDSERHPNYKLFVAAAKATGVKLMVMNQREFSPDVLDDALEQLEASELPLDEQRGIERRLKEMRIYEGFTCAIELSFDHQGRVYLFDVQTDWYEEFSSLVEDLDTLSDDEEEEDGKDALGGYFSKN